MNEADAIPAVLTIAGSDPSGGAGIQADLKTFVTTGAYGAAVITGLTAQNTCEVAGTLAVSAQFVDKQIHSVLSDLAIPVIKLGMLTSREICKAVAPYLQGRLVVCDPVMISTTGFQLIDEDTAEALTESILPMVDYLTPNRFELEKLCGSASGEAPNAGRQLLGRFAGLRGIVLKGGHIHPEQPNVTDTLLYRQEGTIQEVVETRPRHDTPNTHGTGCTFASAFASFLAQGHGPAHAFSRTVDYTSKLIQISAQTRIGHGRGPLMHHLTGA
ncbi:MAG TPA: bifunctional hydroxymethylpyrimidine kinase/phosphomethylpyrimidine kinase [Desulfosalsimonadaceae bacterium]|nr:bifunctional hydroxymethylpyrimidine kinase/phosphomethylpyrimidine kinase [Desulfosalsimonadaceae bacterium]